MDLACKAAAEEELTRWVRDARDFTFHLVEDLTDEQLLGKMVTIFRYTRAWCMYLRCHACGWFGHLAIATTAHYQSRQA